MTQTGLMLPARNIWQQVSTLILAYYQTGRLTIVPLEQHVAAIVSVQVIVLVVVISFLFSKARQGLSESHVGVMLLGTALSRRPDDLCSTVFEMRAAPRESTQLQDSLVMNIAVSHS